ncbi:46152_t:CDS:2, partial [Gigaspora margarita]
MTLNENKENTFFPSRISLEQLDLSEYEDNENTFQYFEKVGFKRFFERHMQFRSLNKKELDLVLMGQLMAFEYNQTNEDSKQKFNYQFNSDIKLCKNTYLKLIGVGKDYLIQINKSLKTKGNYANVHRYPSPGRLQHDTQSIIYLPTNEDYTKAHIFGICNTGQNSAQQLNYIIAENEFPQGTGKGANTTINLVYNGLQQFHNHEKHLKVTFINTVDDVQKVVNKSTKNGANNRICYNNNPRKVLYQTKAYGTYSTFNILKNRFNINEVLDKIPLKSLSKERQ